MFDNDNIEFCAWMDICSLNVSLSEGKIYIYWVNFVFWPAETETGEMA